jgi:hypothetical protein
MPVLTARPWHRLVLPLTVIGVLGLAGCGTTAGATTAGSTADAGQPAAAGTDTDMEAFRTCMAENGVAMPGQGGDRQPPADGTGGSRPSGAPAAPPVGAPAAPSEGAPSAPPDGAQPPAAGAQPGNGAAAGDRPAPPGVDADTWAAAQQACATLAPTPPA